VFGNYRIPNFALNLPTFFYKDCHSVFCLILTLSITLFLHSQRLSLKAFIALNASVLFLSISQVHVSLCLNDRVNSPSTICSVLVIYLFSSLENVFFM
jgi:hypothetical protein